MAKKQKMLLTLGFFLVLLVGSYFGYAALLDKYPTDSSGNYNSLSISDEEEQLAPDFKVKDMDGAAYVKLSDMKGKPVVLNFWASWCSPCKMEMPIFEKAYQEMGDDVHFMIVNYTDGQKETEADASEYIKSSGFTFPVYLDVFQEGLEAYNVNAIPVTYFIDKEGNIVSETKGSLDEETLRKGIEMIQ